MSDYLTGIILLIFNLSFIRLFHILPLYAMILIPFIYVAQWDHTIFVQGLNSVIYAIQKTISFKG